MGNWMPQMDPAALQAAMAKRPVAPPPQMGQAPLNSRPGMSLPQQQLPGPLPTQQMVAPAPIQMGAGGKNLAEPAPPGVQANGLPMMPKASPPPVSDDPVISPELKAAMQKNTDAGAALDAEGAKYNDLSTKAANLKPPSYQDYKPSLLKRIAAPFVGALAGPNASLAVGSMLNGPYNRAQEQYQGQKGALQEQIEAERGIGIPLANDRARVAQENFQNTLNVKKEGREEKTAQANAEYKSDLNDIRKMYDEGRIADAQTRLNETAEKNKNDASRQNEILDLKRQLVDVAQQNADTRANKLGADQGGLSAGEQREFNAKTRRYTSEIDSLNRERSQMIGVPGDFATKRTAAIDARLNELHNNIDQAENDIMGKRQKGGGNAAAAGKSGWQAPAGAPAPTKANQSLRDKNTKKVIAVSRDGKKWDDPEGQ